MKMSIEQLFEQMGKFSMETFPDATYNEHLRKLIKEAEETIQEPNNIYEYADCLLCLFAAAYKAGFTYADLVDAAYNKFKLNEVRTWTKTEDGLYQHN